MATIKLTGRVFFAEGVWLIEIHELGLMTQADSREAAQDEAERLVGGYFEACRELTLQGKQVRNGEGTFCIDPNDPAPAVEVTLTYEDPART